MTYSILWFRQGDDPGKPSWWTDAVNTGLKNAYQDTDKVVAKCSGRSGKSVEVLSRSHSFFCDMRRLVVYFPFLLYWMLVLGRDTPHPNIKFDGTHWYVSVERSTVWVSCPKTQHDNPTKARTRPIDFQASALTMRPSFLLYAFFQT